MRVRCRKIRGRKDRGMGKEREGEGSFMLVKVVLHKGNKC